MRKVYLILGIALLALASCSSDSGYLFDFKSDNVEYSYNLHKEFGGYAFNDESAILFNDPNATINNMRLLYWDWRPFIPSYSFHVHPSGSTTMSSEDQISLQNTSQYGCNRMVILTIDDNGTCYTME